MNLVTSTEFTGKTPLLDDIIATVGESVIDEKPINKFSLLAETHNEFLTEQSFPWTFSKKMEVKVYGNVKKLVEVSVTVKRIKYDPKRNRVGFWITATRGGRSVMTHSPTWFSGCPLHSHVSETIVKETFDEREKLKIVKKDPLGSIMENLLLNASELPFGYPIGDDVTWFWTSYCGFPNNSVSGDGASFQDLRTGNGTGVNVATCYTAIAAWTPAISGNYAELDRGCMLFDTSWITDNFYIYGAYVGTNVVNCGDALGNIDIGLVHYHPTDFGAISAADYQTFGGANYYQGYFVDQWNFDEDNHFEQLNEMGRAYLNTTKNGYSALMCVTANDFYNDPAGLTWASNMRSCVAFDSTVDTPRLVLYYTVAKPTLSVNRSGANLKIGWTVPGGKRP